MLSFGSLTDPTTLPPVIATANGGSFTNDHLVSASTSSGVDLADSGISVPFVAGATDSLTITQGLAGTVTIASSGTDTNINLAYLTRGLGVHSFQPGSDSTQMFQLKNAAATTFASFDSSNKQFRIGDGTAPAQTLDVKGLFQINSSGTPVTEGGVSLVGAGLPGIVYNSISGAATNASITATTMVTAPATNPESCGASTNATCYRISFYALQVGIGTSCTSNTVIEVHVLFQDPLASSSATISVGTFIITTNGTAYTPIPPGTGGSAVGAVGGYAFRAKPSTAIQYQTNVTAGTCSTKPTYWIIPFLEQI